MDFRKIEHTLLNFPFLYSIAKQCFVIYRSIVSNDFLNRCCTVSNKGIGTYKRVTLGGDNFIMIESGTVMRKPLLEIRGHGNRIVIRKNCRIGESCSFCIEGNNSVIEIGDGCSFNCRIHLHVQEDNVGIYMGKDCMLSNNIIIRTSDAHPIYDNITNDRINPAKSVYIGNHVWIAPDSKIFKGAKIGNNSIVGSNSLVTKDVPEDCLVVGMPAKIVKYQVSWSRDRIINVK